MKRFITILGILLTTVILLSGSAVATWLYVGSVVSSKDCTNPDEAIGEEDGDHATIGINSPPTFGWINLSLAALTGMPGYTAFTVFASSTVRENYSLQQVSLLFQKSTIWYGNDDTQDQYFISEGLRQPDIDLWRYFIIESEEGSTNETDPIYGSEIDAIGFDL